MKMVHGLVGSTLALALLCGSARSEEFYTTAEVEAAAQGSNWDSGCDTQEPRWGVKFGAVVLHRSEPDDQTLVRDVGVTDVELLNASDLDLGWEIGPSFSLIRRGDCCWDVEFAFFGVDSWAATDSITATTGTPPYAAGLLTPGNYDDISSRYESQLYSFELNARRNLTERFTVLGGFRYISLDEEFAQYGNGFGAFGDASGVIRTANDLYGFQLGADWRVLCCNRWTVDVWGKTGIYNNHSNGLCTTTAKTTRGCEEEGAFVGEFGVTGTYCLSECWSAYVGYQLMWIDGVALAVDQVALDGVNGIDTGATAFYHGVNFGLQLNY